MNKEIFEKLESFKDLFDSAHDLIHILDLAGMIIYVNASWQRVLGYEQSAMEGKSIYSLVDPQDRARFQEYREHVISLNNHGKPEEVVVGFRSKSGEVVQLEGFVTAKVVNQKPLYTKGIFRDVSRRLKNEAQVLSLHAQLRESERNLRQLFNYAPDAILVIDTNSIVHFWNPKAESIFGWTESEVMGKRLTEIIIPHQYRKAHDEGMKRFLSTGEAKVLNKTIEITSLRRDGREFYVALTISQTLQGGQPAFIAFIRDVDQQKRDSIELEQSKRQLEVSNAELERFAHVASHDMKEPIRKIQIFSEMLSKVLSNESSHLYLGKIRAAAFRLGEMVEGVLKYSAIKGNAIEMERVDLNSILKNISQDLELIIEEKRSTLRYDTLPQLEGAGFLLYQLFYNLILNSLKFQRPGIPPVIEVTAKQVHHPNKLLKGVYFQIDVNDNGIGFEQRHASKIFETFSRLHSHEIPGTGLGLALCKTIVEKHNGIIEAFGKVNAGSTFRILLPAEQG